MGVTHRWALAACVWMTASAPGVRAAEVDVEAAREAEHQAAVLEERIERARQQLDDAARKLAELHGQMWKLETTGAYSKRPMLGILLDDSGTDEGLVLAGVTPEGGAEQAGLKAGDRFVSINGVRLDQGGPKKPMHLLSEAMSTVGAGDAVPVIYVRDGKTHEASIRTQERGRYMAKVVEERQPWLESLQSLADLEDLDALEGLKELEILKGGKLDLSGDVTRVPAGLRLKDVAGDLAAYFEVDRGVLVLDVPGSADALRPGDILLDIGGEAVTSADAALEQLAKLQGEVAARVKRKGRQQQVALDATALNANQAVHVKRGDRRIRIQHLGEGDQVRLEISVDD